MENAPAIRPATPVRMIAACAPPPPPIPAISEELVTSPSIAPKTAGRSHPPLTSRCSRSSPPATAACSLGRRTSLLPNGSQAGRVRPAGARSDRAGLAVPPVPRAGGVAGAYPAMRLVLVNCRRACPPSMGSGGRPGPLSRGPVSRSQSRGPVSCSQSRGPVSRPRSALWCWVRASANIRRAAGRWGTGAPRRACPRMAERTARIPGRAGRAASRRRNSPAAPPTPAAVPPARAAGRPTASPAATRARRPGAARRYRAARRGGAGHPATPRRGPHNPGRRHHHRIATCRQGSSRGRPLATLSSLVQGRARARRT